MTWTHCEKSSREEEVLVDSHGRFLSGLSWTLETTDLLDSSSRSLVLLSASSSFPFATFSPSALVGVSCSVAPSDD